MKKLFILFTTLVLSLSIKAQNAIKDSTGNYRAISRSHKETESKNTGKTFTDSKGNIYPIFESERGKLFYIRVSKSGNEYKVYLKLEN